MAPTFIGGKLRLKGGDSSKKTAVVKKAAASSAKFDTSKNHVMQNPDLASSSSSTSKNKGIANDMDDGLTAAERKSLRIKLEREKTELEKLARKSHRERVEEFNEKLSSLTELNDIPRVSVCKKKYLHQHYTIYYFSFTFLRFCCVLFVKGIRCRKWLIYSYLFQSRNIQIYIYIYLCTFI